jgi:hypothetical protein
MRSCAAWLDDLARQARTTFGAEVARELRVGTQSLPIVLRPAGSRAPLATCAPGDEPCHRKNRRAVLRLERS